MRILAIANALPLVALPPVVLLITPASPETAEDPIAFAIEALVLLVADAAFEVLVADEDESGDEPFVPSVLPAGDGGAGTQG